MGDVTIHRCTVRLVRRAGWSWGPEPRRLVDAVVRVLPLLLAQKLAGAFDDDVAGEITRPVRLRLALPLQQLIALARGVDGRAGDAGGEAAALHELDALLARAVSSLPADVRPLRQVAGAREPESDSSAAADGVAAERRWAGTVLRALLAFRSRGDLDAILASFAPATLASWERAVLRAPADAGPTPTAAPDELAAALAQALAAAAASPLGRAPAATSASATASAEVAARLRLRLRVAAGLAARLGVAPWTAVVRAAIDEALPPLSSPPPASPPTLPVAPPRAPAAASPPLPSPPRPRVVTTVDCAALPFLLLGPLAQIGWLDAAAAAFTAEERSDELPGLAAALAFKVLPPPERGWRRSSVALATAAAFAGVDALPDDLLAALADRPGSLLAPLDAVVARAVGRAHGAGEAFAIARAVSGELLLADLEGLFPIACGDFERVVAAIPTDELVLVAAAAATPSLLAALDRAGRRFVTDAPPVRGERWRALQPSPMPPLADQRWWSNCAGGDDDALAALARRLGDVADELERLWHGLTVERAAVARARQPDLDRTAALAAQTSLSCIAWTLWRRRETAHPALALSRFADLEARVRFGDEHVDVTLPLGSRQRDLGMHRLLDEVPAVPWLGGRAVRFGR